jgi:hypothetical protein
MGVQREVAHDLLVEVGYIANVSHHLTANDLSLNQVPPELMTSGAAQLVRPFPQFSNVTRINPSIGNYTYHAGFVRTENASAAACYSSLTTRFRNFLMTWRPLRSSAPPAATWTPTIAVWIKVSAAATCRTAWL